MTVKTIAALFLPMLLMHPASLAQDVPPAFERSAAADDEESFDPFDPTLNAPKLVRVQVEYIEMSHKDLTRLMMAEKAEKAEKADAMELRMKVQEMVEKDEAKIIDTQIVVGRSGQKQTTESVHEFIYPTDYEVPELDAKKIKELMKEGKFPVTPANPTAFEVRNLGSTLETEPTIDESDRIVDLRLLPDIQWHTGDRVWQERKDEFGNITKVSMPDFYRISLSTAITCLVGQYTMLGTVSPKDAKGEVDTERKVMIFVKCDILSVIP